MTKIAKPERADLKKYNPQQGLAREAAAAAYEKLALRLKDFEAFKKAVFMKWGERRDFVIWWANAGPGTKHGGKQNRGSGILPGMPDSKIVHRWRKKVEDDEAFDRTIEEQLARHIAIEQESGDTTAHVSRNTGEHEWYTPEHIIQAAREVMGGIDLDPASSKAAQKIVQAATFYTVADDGLAQEWAGRVWMNPPYSQPLIGRFCEKVVQSMAEGKTSAAITLTNNASETEWGQLLLTACRAACFPDGRVKFWNERESATPLQGQMIAYLGDDTESFKSRFTALGVVFVK